MGKKAQPLRLSEKQWQGLCGPEGGPALRGLLEQNR